MPLDLLPHSNLVQQKLSRMNINIFSMLEKMGQVRTELMRMLSGLFDHQEVSIMKMKRIVGE